MAEIKKVYQAIREDGVVFAQISENTDPEDRDQYDMEIRFFHDDGNTDVIGLSTEEGEGLSELLLEFGL